MENSQSKPKNQGMQKKETEIVRTLARHGVLPDTGISDEKRRAAKQKRQKESFHNTELLLKNIMVPGIWATGLKKCVNMV